MTRLYDVLSADLAVETGAFCHNQLRLASRSATALSDGAKPCAALREDFRSCDGAPRKPAPRLQAAGGDRNASHCGSSRCAACRIPISRRETEFRAPRTQEPNESAVLIRSTPAWTAVRNSINATVSAQSRLPLQHAHGPRVRP